MNLLLGGNGEGKTSLLEAVAVLGNLRSFRTPRLARAISHGNHWFRLVGEVATKDHRCGLEQVVEAGRPITRRLRCNGASIDMGQYLSTFPVFSITAADRELVVGSPQVRRTFVDRLAFLLEPSLLASLSAFKKLLRQRNAGLRNGAGDCELEAWEGRLAESGSLLVMRRRSAVERLRGSFSEIYDALRGSTFPNVELVYRTESWLDVDSSQPEIAKGYRERYAATRNDDRRTGLTTAGPHRHDLAMLASGRPVRDVLSGGQTKIVACALRLAALAQVEKERGEPLPVLVDDVDAEVDGEVLSQLLNHLGEHRQLFLSSAHEEMVASRAPTGERMWMRQGACYSKPGKPGERP